jgi:hypothetical protein
MVGSQSYEIPKKMISQSGSFELVRYPEYKDLESCFGHRFTLIERHQPGVAIRTDIDSGVIVVGDWYGTKITQFGHEYSEAMRLNEQIIPFAIGIGLKSYQVFFDDKLRITDFVDDKSGFASPQMLELIFSNNFETQVIKDIFTLTTDYDRSNLGIIKICNKTSIDPVYAEIL